MHPIFWSFCFGLSFSDFHINYISTKCGFGRSLPSHLAQAFSSIDLHENYTAHIRVYKYTCVCVHTNSYKYGDVQRRRGKSWRQLVVIMQIFKQPTLKNAKMPVEIGAICISTAEDASTLENCVSNSRFAHLTALWPCEFNATPIVVNATCNDYKIKASGEMNAPRQCPNHLEGFNWGYSGDRMLRCPESNVQRNKYITIRKSHLPHGR